MTSKKNFVLDTNILLHDNQCLYNFADNDIYIPIVVLEELDHFKKGNDQINYNAREFVRELDSITDNNLFTGGASLGEGKGKLFIVVGNQYNEDIIKAFPEKTADHRILSIVRYVEELHPGEKTILLTKDLNLRMKARSLNILSEDYNSDKVQNTDRFQSETRIFNVDDNSIIELIYQSRDGHSPQELGITEKLTPNQCLIIKGINSSVLVRFDDFSGKVVKIHKDKNFGIEARNAEQGFALDVLNNPNIKLVALTGRAGTGKTLMALAAALRQHRHYKQILLARPIVGLSNKDLGYLPGTEQEKIAPYMQPLFDNLNVIRYQLKQENGNELSVLDEMQKSGNLVIEALAYIRGRSLSETFCIIDESQNLTPHEVKTIITRAGEGTKMVFTGDLQQIDSPYLDSESNGLAYMIDHMMGQNIFAHINLVKGERSELSELASQLL